MAPRPKKLSQAPIQLELQDPRGDVLSDILGVALLRHALYRRIDACAPWGIRYTPHCRAVFYLLACGTASLEVDGERPLSLRPGEVAFLPHGTAHTLRDAPTTKPVPVSDGVPCPGGGARKIGGRGPTTTVITGFFDFRDGGPPILLSRLPRLLLLSPTDPTSGPWVTACIQLLLAETAAPGPASAIVLQRLADVLFVHALRSMSSRSECQHRGLNALTDPPIHEALALMHQRVAEPWTVATLAARVGLSRSGFAARFAELVGEPPLQYLARWRLARAAELLRESDEDVAIIANRVGYQSVPSFHKAFKKAHGQSPGSFRRLPREPLPGSPKPTGKRRAARATARRSA